MPGQTLPFGAAPAGSRDFLRFLAALRARPDYHGQMTHVREIPARGARHAGVHPGLPDVLQRALDGLGIGALYTHQAETLHAARAGENVVTVTGTASGKTLAFLLPILERLLENPRATAILLYPTKALAQDQLKGISRLAAAHPGLGSRIRAGVYDGDTSGSARRKIRDEANLILTNPDMLHRGILPYHGKWHRVFRELAFLVVDEVHTYRGIFGANVANVLRRTLRIADHYGAMPRFLCSSATIRNPQELAETLTGQPFRLVDNDGSPRGSKLFVLWNPPYLDAAHMERKSGNVEAKDLLVSLVREGVPTIVFAKARVMAELVYRYATEELKTQGSALAGKLTPYRGGYLPSHRREIERRLFAGELLGVVSTNALELGIDIGGLDASVVVGFPGTVASVWQQAGRAGRALEDALTVFVAYNDPVDQYLVQNPEYFFSQSPEAATCDPGNPYILAGHLSCAAFELPLTEADSPRFGGATPALRDLLVEEGDLTRVDREDYWGKPDFPAKSVNLRTISDNTFTIVDAADANTVIGTVDAISAPELVYPEAIYLHHGETYFVEELDLERKLARVRTIQAEYYTQPVIDASIRVNALRETRTTGLESLALTDATVSWATTMLKKIRFGSMDSIGYKNLDLPQQHLPTVALAWAPSAAAARPFRDTGLRVREGLMGVRNLAISVLPLMAMCDRADVGGIIDASNTGKATLYLYDRFPGGLGFSERAYEEFHRLVRFALDLVEHCGCPEGCPSCVGLPVLRPAIHQDPDAGQGYPIPNKAAAQLLLRTVLEIAS